MARTINFIIIAVIIIVVAGFLVFMTTSPTVLEPTRVSTVQDIIAFQCDERTQYIGFNLNGFDGISEGKDSLTVSCLNNQTGELESPPVVCNATYCKNVLSANCFGLSERVTDLIRSIQLPSCEISDLDTLEFIVDSANQIIAEANR